MEPHPKARSLVLELAAVVGNRSSSLDEHRSTTTMFALGAFMMMAVVLTIVVFPMLMVVMVDRRLLQRQPKLRTEEIGNLQRLCFDAITEPVASPSAWAAGMLGGPGSS